MRFAILGAGAMGSVFGGHLALAGHDVTLVDVWREHMEAVAENGLLMETPDGAGVRSFPNAIADASELKLVDAVIVLTKSFATIEAAKSIVHAVSPVTWIATLQNGLGNDAALATVFSADRVIPGTTTVGAEVLGPGRVLMYFSTAQRKSMTHLGAPRPAGEGIPMGVKQVADALTDAGLPAEAVADADVAIWTKLALAATISPVAAVLGLPMQAVRSAEAGRALMRSVFDEVIRVAHAEGVALDGDALWDIQTAATAKSQGYTSMTTDVLAGRRTENDAMSVEIARRARAHGFTAPICETLGQLVRLRETTTAEANP